MIYSEYQMNIFRAFKYKGSNLVITAVAGSGKTTVILKLLEFSKKMNRKSILLSFNKTIVDELKQKTNDNNISTFHSLGLKILKSKNNSLIVEKDKNQLISKKYNIKILKNKFEFDIYRLADLYRINLCDSYEDLLILCDYYNIDINNDNINLTYRLIQSIEDYNLLNINKEGFLIDFVDMIYLISNFEKIDNLDYDDIFIDESQDMNKSQHVFLEKLLLNKSRFIAVGDPKQSIYGFIGSDINSYQKLTSYPNTIELPLSYCYRCGSNIIEYANQVYNNVSIPPNSHSGNVSIINQEDLLSIDRSNKYLSNSIIISRYNINIASLYLKLIDENIPCYLNSDNLFNNLKTIIINVNTKILSSLINILYKNLKGFYYTLLDRGYEVPEETSFYIKYYEKIQIIELFSKKCSSIEELISMLETSLTNNNGICLMTAHSSKGLEAKNVYIYGNNLFPSIYAKTEQEKEQENNLRYVIYTRAKENLFIINLPIENDKRRKSKDI